MMLIFVLLLVHLTILVLVIGIDICSYTHVCMNTRNSVHVRIFVLPFV